MRKSPASHQEIISPSIAAKPIPPPDSPAVRKRSMRAIGRYPITNFFQEWKTSSRVKRRIREVRKREIGNNMRNSAMLSFVIGRQISPHEE